MTKILVTGSKGQLGSEIKLLEKDYPNFGFVYTDVEELDITNKQEVKKLFDKEKFDFCINCAAYTAVDKAEEDEEKAEKINVLGSKNLALACKENNSTLIQISTDFVYDGKKPRPYKEFDIPNPISVYGKTKLEGEQETMKNNPKTFIIRTSWLYSTFGNNFVKTMLRLIKEKEELRIVSDQTGTPTYARDLAKAVLDVTSTICHSEQNKESQPTYGIYHYSNEGTATWYDFTKAVAEYTNNQTCNIKPIDTEDYPTPAKRPAYSVMNKNKIKGVWKIKIPHWRESLKECLKKI